MRFVVAAAAFVALACAAAPFKVPTYPWNWMTGEQLVGRLTKDPGTEKDYIERDMAHTYLNGIKDGTQGIVWCLAGPILPHELNLDLAFILKRSRTPAELRGPAAPMVLEELRKRYPCQVNERRR